MAGFLTSSQILSFSGAYGKHFNTFKRNIIVSKEPTRTIALTNRQSAPVFGYDSASNEVQYSYAAVTGQYMAMVTYSSLDQKTEELEDIKNVVGKGRVRIKVEKAARDFIEDGRKTENIQFDNKTFNVITFDGVQNYLGLEYFVYYLQGTL